MSDYGVNSPADIARTEFNLFLRQTTPMFIVLIMLIAAAMASEGIVSERARETWDSLIATPLTAREILRSKMLAVIWRMRWLLAILFGLWMIGLVAGAIHPIGLLVSALAVAASIWLMLTFGISISIGAKDAAATTGPTSGARLRSGWFGRSAVPAAGPLKLGFSGGWLAAVCIFCGAGILSRRSQCLAVPGLSFFGVGATRDWRRPARGRRDVPHRHPHPGHRRLLPLALLAEPLRSSDRPAVQDSVKFRKTLESRLGERSLSLKDAEMLLK